MQYAWSYHIYSRNYATVSRAIADALAAMRLPAWVRDLLLAATSRPTLDAAETALCINGQWFDDLPSAAQWHAAWALLHAPFLDDPDPIAAALAIALPGEIDESC